MSNPNMQPSANRPAGVTACGVIGLVLGVIALILSFVPIINNIAFVLGGIGLILAVVGLVGAFRGRRGGKAVAVAAAVLSALSLAVTLAMQAAAGQAIDEVLDNATSQQSTTGDADGAAADAADATGASGAQDMEGDLTDAHVRIVSAVRGGEDYNGQPTVLVTYEWTNTGEANTSFMVVADAAAFQNGRELDVAVYTQTPEGYDANSTLDELQPGATGTATIGYVLADDSPVSVEVSDLFAFDADAPSVTGSFEL